MQSSLCTDRQWSTVAHCLRVFLTSADHVHVATRDGHKIFLLTSGKCEFACEKFVVLSVDTDQPHAPASCMSGKTTTRLWSFPSRKLARGYCCPARRSPHVAHADRALKGQLAKPVAALSADHIHMIMRNGYLDCCHSHSPSECVHRSSMTRRIYVVVA